MRFPYQIIAIVPSALFNSAKTVVQNVCRKGNFTLPAQPVQLGATSAGPVTNVGFQLPLSEQMKSDLNSVKASISTINWFVVDSASSTLLEASPLIVSPPTGQPFDFFAALSLLNLARI